MFGGCDKEVTRNGENFHRRRNRGRMMIII
jgi:hypothetical protein